MKSFCDNEFEKYKTEVEERWKDTKAYSEYTSKTKGYSNDKWNNLNEMMNDIIEKFTTAMKNNEKVYSSNVQNLVKVLQNHISENYYLCTNEILAGLGKMYVLDDRFKKNIDKHELGTAEYISKAIEIYCNK